MKNIVLLKLHSENYCTSYMFIELRFNKQGFHS